MQRVKSNEKGSRNFLIIKPASTRRRTLQRATLWEMSEVRRDGRKERVFPLRSAERVERNEKSSGCSRSGNRR